jgi:hypothetical protein
MDSILSVDEAMKLAFPGCPTKKETIYLTDAQLERANAKSSEKISSKLVTRYLATCGGVITGTGYVDSHVLRTKPESLLVLVGRSGEIRRVEVLSFIEPPEYQPKSKWYGQFGGKTLAENLRLREGISFVTGSTITAKATLSAVRRVLAIHHSLSLHNGLP